MFYSFILSLLVVAVDFHDYFLLGEFFRGGCWCRFSGGCWTVGAVCKDSNSLKSRESILLLLIHSRPFFALLAGIVPLVFCELFLLPSADNVLRHLCRQFQTTALELFFEGGILLCQFLRLVF